MLFEYDSNTSQFSISADKGLGVRESLSKIFSQVCTVSFLFMGQHFHSSTFSNETQTLNCLHARPRTACYNHIGLVSLLWSLKTQIQRMHKRLSDSKDYSWAVTTLVPTMGVLVLKEIKHTTFIPPTILESCRFWKTAIRSTYLQTKPTTEVLM